MIHQRKWISWRILVNFRQREAFTKWFRQGAFPCTNTWDKRKPPGKLALPSPEKFLPYFLLACNKCMQRVPTWTCFLWVIKVTLTPKKLKGYLQILRYTLCLFYIFLKKCKFSLQHSPSFASCNTVLLILVCLCEKEVKDRMK